MWTTVRHHCVCIWNHHLLRCVRHHCICLEAYLRLTWPFIALQLALWYFLTQTDQGQDILKSETLPPWKEIIFLICLVGFAFFVWMLKRTLIEWTDNNLKFLSEGAGVTGFTSKQYLPFVNDNVHRQRARRYRYHVPVISSVLLLPFLGLWLAGVWYMVGLGIATLIISLSLRLLYASGLDKRGPLISNIFAVIGMSCLVLFLLILWWWPPGDLINDQKIYWYIVNFNIIMSFVILSLWFQRLGQFATYFTIFWFFAAPPLFFYACFHPVEAADLVGHFGIYNIAFVGFLFLMVFAFGLVWLAYKFPINLLATTAVLFIIFWLPIDKHRIRDCSGCSPLAKQSFPHGFPFDLNEAIDRWYQQNPDDGQPRTMILVAAAGGGSRAAYWAGSVLGAIQDKIPDFQRHLFAISAVSGGALGGAAFAAALGPDPPSKPHKPVCNYGLEQSYHGCLKGFLSQDFLGPVLASFLTGDLVKRVAPLPSSLLGYDRGGALELGWESAWAHTLIGHNRMADPFDALWNDSSYQVNLLLNGTMAYAGEKVPTDPGERVVTSNLLVEKWADAAVVNPAEHARFRLSTAIDNSTRFPFVEPAGSTTVNPSADGQAGIVDGGYYDNYGAATILDLLSQMNHYWGDPRLQNLELIIIQISSNPDVVAKLDDPHYGRTCEMQGNLPRPATQRPEELLAPSSEALSAYRTAMAAREWAGLAYAKDLRRWHCLKEEFGGGKEAVKKPPVHYIHFGMRAEDTPLGWNLSPNSLDKINKLLEKGSDVNKEIAEICYDLHQPNEICEGV
jgi:hypothetical protein